MADNEQTQVKPAAQPVKKRRFFRPRPKVKPEAEAVLSKAKANVHNAYKPKSKNFPQPSNEQGKPAARQEQPTLFSAKAQSKPKVHPHAAKFALSSQPAHKTMAKNTSTFRARRPRGVPKQRLSDIDFKYLDTPEYRDIYALVIKAKDYFATDKETCCAKFRIANEAIIERLIKDLQLTEAVAKKELSTNYFEQINLLAKEIPEDMVDGNIFTEMHNLRMIGNSFAHGDDKYDANRGSKTCLIAMEKICQWLVVFEPKYLSYQRAKNMTKSNFFTDIWNGILSIFKGR